MMTMMMEAIMLASMGLQVSGTTVCRGANWAGLWGMGRGRTTAG